MERIFWSLFFTVVLLCSGLSTWAEDFYVIAVNRKPRSVITVAKSNGDFKDPVAAINSITDASESNPYLVLIAPGVYTVTQTLVMKEYVELAGSGEMITKLTGAISTSSSSTSAIVSGANNSALNSLTVENTGGSSHYSCAIYNEGSSPKVSHVTASAFGGNVCAGIYNTQSSSPTMTDVITSASNGGGNYGVYNIEDSSPTMMDVTASASRGVFNVGIFNYGSSSPTMTNVTALASGANSYGVYNSNFSYPKIRRCTITGGNYGLKWDTDSFIQVSQSTIIGGVNGHISYARCVACDNGLGDALDSNCQD